MKAAFLRIVLVHTLGRVLQYQGLIVIMPFWFTHAEPAMAFRGPRQETGGNIAIMFLLHRGTCWETDPK